MSGTPLNAGSILL